MARRPDPNQQRRDRLNDERGRLDRQARHRIALAYPARYGVGMSSLGFQAIYRAIQTSDDFCCERIFAPDEPLAWDRGQAPVSYESGHSLAELPVAAFSVSWELDLIELLRMLHRSGIPPLRQDRNHHHPLILAGGPLTFSNPAPLLPFVDALVIGEADSLVIDVLRVVFDGSDRDTMLTRLAALPHVIVPGDQALEMPRPCRCDDSLLPAWGPICTPHAELRNMFLVEAVRGCSRGCHYCVMRRSTNGGMRVVPKETVLGVVPQDATRVGLVGASVTDHPHIEDIVRSLVDRGLGVGLSSLRADRLHAGLVEALRQAGYRTLTTAMDGASERLRELVERKTTEAQLREAANLCRQAGIERLKLYVMVGMPSEEPEDIEECARLVKDLSRIVPVSLGISPFCAKRNTPLAQAPYAGLAKVDAHLALLRRKLAGAAELRATSSRWAWIESVLAAGGEAEGRATLHAVQNGGGFSAFRKAFGAIGHLPG